jgi:hypothetical protein
MERVELTSRYTAVDPHSAKSLWDDMYESCLTHCMHGPACSLGASCNHGRRITTVRSLALDFSCTCLISYAVRMRRFAIHAGAAPAVPIVNGRKQSDLSI